MAKYILFPFLLVIFNFLEIIHLNGQLGNDLKKAVPVWFEYHNSTDKAVLKWVNDPAATTYNVGSVKYQANPTFTNMGTVNANIDSFVVAGFEVGKRYNYRITKATGSGFIDFGIEQPLIHQRGRCLLVLDSRFVNSLEAEINVWSHDILADGWLVDTIHILQTQSVVSVKTKIKAWYKTNYSLSQSVILFGNIPVPYSGNTAIDGHPDHSGAWPSDVYYADMDGVWTDLSVNNAAATRIENQNTPGDGKFDQVIIPSAPELEIGRIDFSKLPALAISETELLRKYLNKNHQWRIGEKPYTNRAIIENNFASFEEGFGQNGWRNFLPMFGNGQVISGDYDQVLQNNKYVFSYACGPGSYTSCGGIGTTQNLWATKSLQTVFTMNFGSYFGDWDTQNNFLRSALASGDVLTNCWAGRPNWYLTSMASGAHIGFGTRLTQNASNVFFSTGFGEKSSHVALMGDPTLRLHPILPVKGLTAVEDAGTVLLQWGKADPGHNMFMVYRVMENGEHNPISMVTDQTQFAVNCMETGKELTFMVKSVELTQSGSGSYFNSSIGKTISITINESNIPVANFLSDIVYEKIQCNNLSNNSSGYLWSFGDGNQTDQISPVHIYNAPGVYEVCLTATNGICPESKICKNVNIASSLPVINAYTITKPKCFGDSNGSIEVMVTGDQNVIRYIWNNGEDTKDVFDIGAGEYSLEIQSIITEDKIRMDFIVDQPEPISVSVATTPSTGSDNGTADIAITGGTPPYSITPLVDLSKLAPGTYEIEIQDFNNCNKKISFTIDLQSSVNEFPSGFELYPLPVSQFLTVQLRNQYDKVYITDIQGKMMWAQNETIRDVFTIDCHLFPTGTYVFIASDKHHKEWKKLFSVIKP
ncbi:MAG: PKD domain-containing protein [Saprospiraceae bacterium]|nr:PKD domain-containing protein [Saprospiraceae bacterium]